MCANGSSNHMTLQSLLRLYSSILGEFSFESLSSSNLFSLGFRFRLIITRAKIGGC